MDRDAVLARLMLLTEDDRTALLETLAGDAARMVEARLRCTEAEAAANAEALTAAAAAYAAYQLALVDASCAPDSLTAGDVRAEYKNNCARALDYYKTCAAAVAGGAATVKTAQGAYTVLECAPVAGLRGRVCVEALLEERRESDDGQ